MSVPRKTVKERVLYARVIGFYDCLRIFEEAWRRHGYQRGWDTPEGRALWAPIEEAQKAIRPTDDEWRALHFGRADNGKPAKKRRKAKRKAAK